MPDGSERVFRHGLSVYFILMTQSSISGRTGACITAILIAATTHAGEHASHGAQTRHLHGSAQLNLVVDGALVHIELISPTFNLVGFEHAPVSEAEHTAHQNALSILKSAERLFQFDRAADCRAGQTEIATESAPTAQPTARDRHRDRHHADITTNYQFFCNAPDGPVTLRVGLFEAFPAIDDLLVQYVTGGRQGGAILSSSKPVLTF